MQQVWLALIGGLILGWLIEWIVDWQFWRRNLDELRAENQTLRRQLADSQAQLAALQPAPTAQPTPAAPGATVVAPSAVSPDAPTAMPAEEPDSASAEADSHSVTTAPPDPQAEGE